MQITKIAMADIVPYENNVKLHPKEQIEQIKKSIVDFGNNDPIAVDENNVIIEGHGRFEALKELGYEEAECIVLTGLTEDQKNAYRLVHNKLTMNSDFDMKGLEEELNKINMDLTAFDFDPFNINEEEKEIIEDEAPEVDEEHEPITKMGDIWELGNHRLMCGDSTQKENVERLTGGQLVDLVFTDPPYGICASGGRSQTKEKLKMKEIINDNLKELDLVNFLCSSIKAMLYKDNASIYICYPWQTQEEFTNAIKSAGLNIKNCIIWDKKTFGLNGGKGYRPQYEMIYFCCKNDFNWMGDLSQSNIWSISREIKRKEQGNHPTPKPIELIAKALKNSSKNGDKVLDSFGGSGSTLIACEQLDRKCYMMELDPKYCDVIIKRWETLTGKKAKLIKEEK